MSAEHGRAADAACAAQLDVAVIVALALEHASFKPQRHAGAPATVSIRRSGPGAARAAQAAQAALAGGADALISWGLAGALTPDVAAGTVVLPREIAVEDGASLPCDSVWQARLAHALGGQFVVEQRSLLGAPQVLATPQAKARAARATGAVAVDTESAGVAQVAARAGKPFVVLRVIVDTHADHLPPDAERWIDEHGRQRIGAVLGAALAPAQWPTLWVLGRRYRAARRVLDRLAARLVPNAFFLPAARCE